MAGEPVGLAVDLSTASRARIALVVDRDAPTLANVEEHEDSSASTLTSILVDYERRSGVTLRGVPVAIAIAGVAGRNVVPITRSRWTLSRNGLDQFFGRPVTILNEVAAKAWAALADEGAATSIGTPAPAAPSGTPGRRVMISLVDGLGVAVIDRDRQGVRVIETEAGHLGFAPREEGDEPLLRELRATGRPATWERAIGLASRSPARAAMSSRLLADFVAEAVLAAGAWDGAYLTGPAFEALAGAAEATAFMARLRGNRSFPRLFAELPCWLVRQEDAVLRGCARLLSAGAADS